jgi:hypothetical protein
MLSINLLNDQYNKKDEEIGGSTFEYEEIKELSQLPLPEGGGRRIFQIYI